VPSGVRTPRAVFTNAELMAQDLTVRWPEADRLLNRQIPLAEAQCDASGQDSQE